MGVPEAAEPAASMEVSPRRLGTEALVETTLVRGGVDCFGGTSPPPAFWSCRAERWEHSEGRAERGHAACSTSTFRVTAVVTRYGSATSVPFRKTGTASSVRSQSPAFSSAPSPADTRASPKAQPNRPAEDALAGADPADPGGASIGITRPLSVSPHTIRPRPPFPHSLIRPLFRSPPPFAPSQTSPPLSRRSTTPAPGRPPSAPGRPRRCGRPRACRRRTARSRIRTRSHTRIRIHSRSRRAAGRGGSD